MANSNDPAVFYEWEYCGKRYRMVARSDDEPGEGDPVIVERLSHDAMGGESWRRHGSCEESTTEELFALITAARAVGDLLAEDCSQVEDTRCDCGGDIRCDCCRHDTGSFNGELERWLLEGDDDED